MTGCYLLHFAQPFHHAQHYIGFSDDILARVEAHRQGRGSKLVRAVVDAGITFQVARLWLGKDRAFERALHNRHGSRMCPICAAIKAGKSGQ